MSVVTLYICIKQTNAIDFQSYNKGRCYLNTIIKTNILSYNNIILSINLMYILSHKFAETLLM